MTPPFISKDLLDEKILAKELYNYWMSLLKTDKAEGVDATMSWDSLDDPFRQDFEEAVRTVIVIDLKDYVQDVEKNGKFEDPNTPKHFPCYICSGVAVQYAGGVCNNCAFNHLGD